MGREWLYKVSGGEDGGSRGNGKSPSTATSTAMNRKTRKEKKNSSSSSGCMNAIFNLFDIQHPHLFRVNHLSFISESTIINHQQSNFVLQGVEAPRNSLESPESAMNVVPSSSKLKQQTNLNIPMGGIQIKTQRSRFKEDISSECSSSPGTKTPNLVARLMGLDLLPEYSSPRPSSSSTPAASHHRSHSLPTTPRVSTGSRRSTENKDYHHRLSLQINKENYGSCQGQEHGSLQTKTVRRRSEFLVNRKDNDDDSQYAKKIANQVKEITRRRLGTDITNTMSSASRNKSQRRDSNLVLLKPKKTSASSLASTFLHVYTSAPTTKTKQDDSTRFSSSQKLRLLDIKSNLNKANSKSKSSKSKPLKDEKIKRSDGEIYDLRLNKSTSLPNHCVKNMKKKMTSPSSTTRLPQKQMSLVKLPSSLNSPYKANDINVTTATSSAANGDSFSDHDQFNYISRILKHCGIHTTTPISSGQWYSLNHPLHPSIFNQLEKLHHPTATAAAMARRRMIFEIVNVFLMEILKPYMNQKPWVFTRQYNNLKNVIPPDSFTMCGSELIKKLCKKITSFQSADCEALEDIDRLIETDMRRTMLWSTAFETEAEEIVKEIENEIVETLVHEVATAITDRVRSHVLFT